MKIFTYGTLMIPEIMYAVTTRRFRFKNAILRGYARFTVKGESYPGIIPVADAVTKGIVYFDVDELSLERLDVFEGDLYQRTSILAEMERGEILNAEAYVVKPEFRNHLSSSEWNIKEFAQKHLEAFLATYSSFQKNSYDMLPFDFQAPSFRAIGVTFYFMNYSFYLWDNRWIRTGLQRSQQFTWLHPLSCEVNEFIMGNPNVA